MFKFGGHWRGKLTELRLAGLSRAKKELGSIPGKVRVDADLRVVELARPRKRVELGHGARKKQGNDEDVEN